MSFDPGLRSSGAAHTRAPYALGDAGIRQSLEAMCQKMREGRVDPRIIGNVGRVLSAAGLDGRNRSTTVAAQVGALLNDLRAPGGGSGRAIYAPDPYGSELIQGAAATLCLAPGLCLNRGDCFPKGTLFLREDYAIVPVEEIEVGDRIWGRDKWTRVEAKTFKGSLPIDAVRMNNGSTLQLTPDHHVYALRCQKGHGRTNGDYGCTCSPEERVEERVRVRNLKPFDVLAQPKRISFGSKTPDPDRAYVEGLYIADGWAETSHARRFFISGQDGCRKEAQKRDVEKICARLGIPTTWARKHITVRDVDWALRVEEMGHYAPEKHFLSIDLGKAAAEASLRGVMADSSANSKSPGTRTFTTTSRLLSVQVRVLNRMFGQSMAWSYLTAEQHGGLGPNPIWRLSQRSTGRSDGKREKILRVKSIQKRMATAVCWDIQTEDHYVYLPEHDVTVSNCDDLTVALGSETMSLGIPTMIVKQTFGADAQEHVLLGVYDGSDWRYADPSTNLPFGSAVGARSEVWIDPTEPLGDLPAMQPEIITLGSIRSLGKIPGIGIGTIFGLPTVDDLAKLLDVAAYDLQQIQAAVSSCQVANGGFSDPAVWAAWNADLQQTNADFNAATQVVADVVNSTPHWLQGFNVINYQWGMVRGVIDSCIDLDRRWRVLSNCTPPTYPDTPQPIVAGDVDQWTYNASNSAIKGIESAARNATQPVVIALGGLATGLVLAVAAAVGLNALIPHRR